MLPHLNHHHTAVHLRRLVRRRRRGKDRHHNLAQHEQRLRRDLGKGHVKKQGKERKSARLGRKQRGRRKKLREDSGN
jgi:hypothetical protein